MKNSSTEHAGKPICPAGADLDGAELLHVDQAVER